jgi:nitroimidazol reductase NimA-like FMN-containing flavoprotein (pyridoxamine 5'-phosphate oxidase superfamily)
VGRISALPEDQIERLLQTAIVGRIACCAHGRDGGDGRPYVVPLAFGYDGEALYAHSGPGRKIGIMRAQPLVTIEVDEAEASDRWRSVIAEGVYEELTEPAERDRALGIIYLAPGDRPDLGDEVIVYRIRLTSKSGRVEVPNAPD